MPVTRSRSRRAGRGVDAPWRQVWVRQVWVRQVWVRQVRVRLRRSTPSRATTISRIDLFGRFRDKGWLGRTAFIDPHGSWTYAQLVERAQKFSLVLQEKGIQPGERVLMCLLDTIDWPSVFLGTLHAGRVAVPVNTLDDRRRLPLHARRLGRADARGLAGAAAEIREAGDGAARLPPDRRRQPRGAAAPGSRPADRGRRQARTVPRRRPATTSHSGSTPRARPASRRPRCMCMPTSS